MFPGTRDQCVMGESNRTKGTEKKAEAKARENQIQTQVFVVLLG